MGKQILQFAVSHILLCREKYKTRGGGGPLFTKVSPTTKTAKAAGQLASSESQKNSRKIFLCGNGAECTLNNVSNLSAD